MGRNAIIGIDSQKTGRFNCDFNICSEFAKWSLSLHRHLRQHRNLKCRELNQITLN